VLQRAHNGAIAIYCTAGALGKCIRWGYRPWAVRDGVALRPYWQACVRMVQADYCGDDRPTTRDGMQISIYDPLGINPRGGGLEFPFEAAWDADGARCVAHPRLPQNITLDALEAACPRLAGHLGASCTESAARRLGQPLLFNASRGDGVPGD
jgi:ADYC domain-containing protein